MKINKEDVIKIAGILGTVMSVGATLLNSYSDKKELDILVDKKINEAMQKRLVESVKSQL